MPRTLTVSLPPEVIEAVQTKARAKNVSVSFLVRYALEFIYEFEPSPEFIQQRKTEFKIARYKKTLERLERESMGG